jgi:hypothetical protein
MFVVYQTLSLLLMVKLLTEALDNLYLFHEYSDFDIVTARSHHPKACLDTKFCKIENIITDIFTTYNSTALQILIPVFDTLQNLHVGGFAYLTQTHQIIVGNLGIINHIPRKKYLEYIDSVLDELPLQ